MSRSSSRRSGSPRPVAQPPLSVTGAGGAAAPGGSSVEFREYVDVLWRRKGLIVVVVALCVGAAVAYTLTRTPVYISSASVLVEPISVDPNRTAIRPDQLVNLLTEREVVRSASVAAIVTERLGDDTSIEQLLARVSVGVPPSTQILEIAYESPDPARAQRVAQTFAEVYLEQRRGEAVAEIERRSTDIRARIAEAEATLEEVNEVIADSPDASSQLAVAESRRDILIGQVAQLQTELAQVAALSIDPGRIIGPAFLPEQPAAPSHPTNVAIGLVLGALLGIMAAFARDRLDDRLHDGAEVTELLGLPLLASLPRWGRSQDRLVLVEDPESLAAEAFRRLRTTVLTVLAGRSFTALVVTSAVPREGKSTTAANLAVALAQAGRRVLLVSADLRLPSVHRLLGLNNECGLSDLLSGGARLSGVVQEPPGIENLEVIASGPTPEHPGDLLQSETLRQLATRADGKHEIVLFDAPPVLAVADCLTLSRLVDGVIIVSRARSTRRDTLAKAADQLRAAGGNLIGVVLSNARPSDEEAFDPYRVPSLPLETVPAASNGAGPARQAVPAPPARDAAAAPPAREAAPAPPAREAAPAPPAREAAPAPPAREAAPAPPAREAAPAPPAREAAPAPPAREAAPAPPAREAVPARPAREAAPAEAAPARTTRDGGGGRKSSGGARPRPSWSSPYGPPERT
jgi:succinoglycan biosynthesis transport protein ExoP